MQALTDALLALFLALGSAWFAIDLVRKLRAPAGSAGHQPGTVSLAQAPTPTPLPISLPAPVVTAVAAAPAPTPTPTPAPAPAPAPAPTPVADTALPAPHLAAIAAAVHHLFRGRARLLSAAPAMPAANPGAHATIDWAREGRRDIFSSRRVR